jgi:uncharacterized protein (UPF0335 family)
MAKKNEAPPADMPEANRTVFAKAYVDRMTTLLQEQADLAECVSDLKTEIKAAGLTPAAVVKVAKLQIETGEQREKRESLEREVEQIMAALGMLADTPLGQAARQAA